MPSRTPGPNTEESTWYDAGLHFTCTQCGNCCTGSPGYVFFDDAEAAAIAAFLGLEEAEFRERYAHKAHGRWTLDEVRTAGGDYDCIFLKLNEQGKRVCSIYSVRPLQCRTWPFWPENLRNERSWLRAAQNCPGMANGIAGKGDFYPVERIRIIRDQHD